MEKLRQLVNIFIGSLDAAQEQVADLSLKIPLEIKEFVDGSIDDVQSFIEGLEGKGSLSDHPLKNNLMEMIDKLEEVTAKKEATKEAA